MNEKGSGAPAAGKPKPKCWLCKGWTVVAPYKLADHEWDDGTPQFVWGPSAAVIRPGARECPACGSGKPDVSDPGGAPDEAEEAVRHGL